MKLRPIFILIIAVLITLSLVCSGCSSDSGSGRFVVDNQSQPTPSANSNVVAETSPSPSPTQASTSPMDEVMKQAGQAPPGSFGTNKLYLQMPEEERYDFIEQRARHISSMIGSGTYEFSRPSINLIKQYVDAYARRVGNGSKATWGEDLNLVFGRGQRYAPTIIRAFNRRGIPPAIGLYLVAIETEYTNFEQENSAGAAGLFQFIPATAEGYGVAPNERTNVNKMSDAAAHYIADRISEFGTDPMSVALCIAGYNRSPDSVRSDLQSVMNSANKERSFWTLVTNSDKLDHWFQGENIKYVPKYFAAAIVGETPWAFGLNMKQALSTCTDTPPADQRIAAKP
ncbi:MAG TPA: transglycosylase SLT domain-containing protein [Pyrinomonadaceae bacterium]